MCACACACVREMPPEVPWPFSCDDLCLMWLHSGLEQRSNNAASSAKSRTVCEVKHLNCEGGSGTRGSQPRLSSFEFHFSLWNGTYDPNCVTTCLKTCMCMHACMWVFVFKTGGIILHNIHTTTSLCYCVGVRAWYLTQICARICAGKHVSLHAHAGVPGFWTPAETRRNSVTS